MLRETLTSFDSFIRSLRLRHFEPVEFLIGLDRGNTSPPPELWPNIALTAKILDEVREHFGRSVHITSAYRSPLYNRSVGGSRLSQHQAFTAVDFQVRLTSSRWVAETLVKWRGRGFELPGHYERVHYESPHGPVPFAPLETWHQVITPEHGNLVLGGGRSWLRFAGGVGSYSSFVHLDTRGLNHSWSGA